MPPPPEGSLVQDEYLVVGRKRLSNRGKRAEVNTVGGKLKEIMGVRGDTPLIEHELKYVEADVDGAALQVLGAVREGKYPDGTPFIQTNMGLVPIGEGRERSPQDHLRVSAAPGKDMSKRDKENLRK